jgi:hypothetical protein
MDSEAELAAFEPINKKARESGATEHPDAQPNHMQHRQEQIKQDQQQRQQQQQQDAPAAAAAAAAGGGDAAMEDAPAAAAAAAEQHKFEVIPGGLL